MNAATSQLRKVSQELWWSLLFRRDRLPLLKAEVPLFFFKFRYYFFSGKVFGGRSFKFTERITWCKINLYSGCDMERKTKLRWHVYEQRQWILLKQMLLLPFPHFLERGGVRKEKPFNCDCLHKVFTFLVSSDCIVKRMHSSGFIYTIFTRKCTSLHKN